MPIWVASLVGGLGVVVSSLVGRVLLALGIGYATYTGISTALGSIQSQIVADLSGMPAMILTVAYLLKIDVVISIAFSAIAAKLTVAGLVAGSVSRARITP